ncbi:hypothetical protein ACJVVZ_05675 [Staphylococcus pseudintermedius]|uniref:hypothetical protein n=1 Tax=Staphylococcus pseudintermedius TaxID=283734 RepID=UPI001EE437EF|nr:hypothetical protein [Staphylococcus pseudintermedius]MDK3882896.1 hypothetical protein [Staphylococcus pseudintermedius]
MTTLPTAGKPIYYRDFIIVPVFILLQYTFPLLAEEVFPNLLERLFDYTLQPSGYNILFNVMMCLAQVIVIANMLLLGSKRNSLVCVNICGVSSSFIYC